MHLVEQWNTIERGLDPRWDALRLVLRIEDDAARKRAVALLGPAGPGAHGSEIRLHVMRRSGVGPEALRRLFRRLDEEGISGTLELVSEGALEPDPVLARPTRTAEWDAALSLLPADWTDLIVDLTLTSSDHADRGALLLAPVNPLKTPHRPAFRFRVARTFGYGASPGMVRRCLERLDEAEIPGELDVVTVSSDTHPVGTQGPVWYIGGRAT